MCLTQGEDVLLVRAEQVETESSTSRSTSRTESGSKATRPCARVAEWQKLYQEVTQIGPESGKEHAENERVATVRVEQK